jgi:GTP-binding protein HflX
LEEITEADLILHVVDITHPNAAAQAAIVAQTLADLEADDIPTVVALNKIDRLPDPEAAIEQVAQYPNSLAISAATGQGLPALLDRIEGILQSTRQMVVLLIPYDRGDLVALLHEQAIINQETHQADGTRLEVYLPAHLRGMVEQYRLEPARV